MASASENITDVVPTSVMEWHGSTLPSEGLDGGLDNHHQEQSSPIVVVVLRTLFVILNAVFIMVANAFCIYVVKSSRYMSAASKTFTIALAITDFATGLRLSVDLILPSILDYWPYGETYCQISGDFAVMTGSLSISYLLLLGIDRVIVIRKGLYYGQIMTKKRALAAAIGALILNVALYFPLPCDFRAKSPLPYPRPYYRDGIAAQCFHMFTEVPLLPLLAYVTISIFIPEVTALWIYVTLIFTATKQKARLLAEFSERQQKSLAGSIMMFSFAMLGFVIAYTPFTSMIIYEAVSNQRPPEWIEFSFIWITMSNSWWNVIIYANSNRLWRKEAAKAIRHLKNRIF